MHSDLSYLQNKISASLLQTWRARVIRNPLITVKIGVTGLSWARKKRKNADHEIFSNFRPISNLKLISKLIEKAVASQLTDYLSFNSLHESFQSAYKRYHSSETALLRVYNDILRSIDNGGGVILVLLHLSAAFDTVNLELLLSRLSTCYGLCGSVLNWFTSYLINRTQFVDINGTFSTIRHFGVRVPQGSVLGHYFIFYALLLLRILFPVIILTFTFTVMIHNYFYRLRVLIDCLILSCSSRLVLMTFAGGWFSMNFNLIKTRLNYWLFIPVIVPVRRCPVSVLGMSMLLQ